MKGSGNCCRETVKCCACGSRCARGGLEAAKWFESNGGVAIALRVSARRQCSNTPISRGRDGTQAQ